MEPVALLRNLGIPVHESRVYLALLTSGPLTVAGIARVAGLHRPRVYRTIPALERRGLIAVVPKGKLRYYSAAPPAALTTLAQQHAAALATMLPDLERRFTARAAPSSVRLLEGRAGIRAAYEDFARSTKRGDTYYRYSSRRATTDWKRYFPKGLVEHNKHLQRFVISGADIAEKRTRDLNRAVKIVPPAYDLFAYDIVALIYANKIAYLDFNTETALIIENEKNAEFQRKLFKLLYDKL